jgi:hypothetical protein
MSEREANEASAAEAAPLGEKSAALLLSLFQDTYRQEVAAEEDVHRTLPFFATALGLIVAALNYVASQLPPLEQLRRACRIDGKEWIGPGICAWPAIFCILALVAAALLGVGVLWLLALATKRRGYQRVGPESSQLERARALQQYHGGKGLVGEPLDQAVQLDLRDQIIASFAAAIPANREITLQRYKLRARAVAYLLWSLFSALIATIIAIGIAKFGLLPKMPL